MSVKYQGSDSLDALLALLKTKFDSKPDKKDNLVVNKILSHTWTDGRQTISVDGVKEDSIVDILISTSATDEQATQFELLNLQDGGQAEGTITLTYKGTANTATIPIVVVVRGNYN